MLDAALTALSSFLDPWMLLTLMLGVLAGLVLGMVPGIGGTGSMAILLPFIFLLEPQQALALVIGAAAVIHTSDTISTVLLGIPGSASSSVVLLDGHAMAKQGQASRALSIAFFASAIGGLIGAFGLTVSIAVAQPLVMLFASPELFMLTILGISMASLLSRGNVAKGLLAASFGLLLGQIGVAPASAEYRYTFDSLFLAEGLDIVAVALGVFGLAEILSLAARKTSVSQGVELGDGWRQGIADVLRNWTHLLRGSLVGIWVGIIPGVGATAGSWLAYGQTVATAKDKRKFGKGDPRGVVAPEGASNSISAGDLIPTLLFGIPGSAAAALLLGALLVFGIEPGPSLLGEELGLVYTIVWSFGIAAVLGALLCFMLAKPLAKLSFVRFPILAAGLIVIMFVSSFQGAQEFGVLQIMLALGVIGWLMKHCDYPRAPLLIGFVLSIPLERYYFLTERLYEPAEWMSRPAVLVMMVLLVAPVVYACAIRVRARARARARGDSTRAPATAPSPMESGGEGPDAAAPERIDADGAADAPAREDESRSGPVEEGAAFAGTVWSLVTALGFLVLFAGALVLSQSFSSAGRLVPQLVSCAGLTLGVIVAAMEWRRLRKRPNPSDTWKSEAKWAAIAFGWLCLFLALIYLVGTVLATVIFVPVFLRRVAGLRYWAIAVYTAVLVAVLLAMQQFADIPLPQGWFMPVLLM